MHNISLQICIPCKQTVFHPVIQSSKFRQHAIIKCGLTLHNKITPRIEILIENKSKSPKYFCCTATFHIFRLMAIAKLKPKSSRHSEFCVVLFSSPQRLVGSSEEGKVKRNEHAVSFHRWINVDCRSHQRKLYIFLCRLLV